MTGCLRCGVPSYDRDDPLERPVTRSFESGWRHRECYLRAQYEDWKATLARMNEIPVSQVKLGAADGDGTPDGESETDGVE